VTGPDDADDRWPVHSVERVWDGAAPFAVRLDTISAPDRPDERFDRLVLEHPGAVVVLAVDEQERALVLQQYRHPVGLRMVELPAGLVDVGEDPEAAARRELREEGMVLADQWQRLLSTYPSPGVSSERIAIYLARRLRPAPDRGDFVPAHEEAEMALSRVSVAELLDGVLSGRLADGPLGHAVMAYTLRHA
jgi:8-oxo-dGDP phosphatase